MARIFLSHSSSDELEAVALRQWLADAGWDEVFLDVDPQRGLVAGERWQEALKRAADRCEAVLFLVSPAWAQSKWCLAEFLLAKSLNKRIFGLVLKEVAIGELPTELTAESQLCHLVGAGATTAVSCVHREQARTVHFLADGLARLEAGLRSADLQPDFFPWPPKDDPERPPYRGLEPLDAADAAVFFGRDAEILQGLDTLRGMRATGGEALFVILGASGAGKSSFLRAGLLPRLARDERHFLPLPPVRPERSPIHGERGLAHAIHAANLRLNLAPATLGEVKAALREGPARLVALLQAIQHGARARLVELPADAPAPTLVLPLDQAEELFNAEDGEPSGVDGRSGAADEARAFLRLIGAALRAPGGGPPGAARAALIVAVTIRSDRYEPLQTAPELAGLKSVVFDALKPMPGAQYKEVITGPAQRATAAGRALRFQPALVARLLADCEHSGDALPLLSLTLARLFRDYGSGGELRLDQYEAMGGMADVIKAEAESVLAADAAGRATQLELLRDAFIPALVTINPRNDQPMRRVAALSDLPADSRPLVRALVDKRLLLSDLRAGEQVVEVAHESLLRQWDVLAAWLRDERADLKDVDRLEQAVAAWLHIGRKPAWLMEGDRLEIAEQLAAKPRYRRRLEGAREFLLASRQRETERREAEARRREERLQAEQALRRAAEERQQSAEKLAATEARERAAAEAAATRLKRQARTLRVAVGVVVLALGVALFGFERARSERESARAALRVSNALRLASESLAMLDGERPGGGERALLQLVAARRTASHVEIDSALLAALLANDMKKLWSAGAAVKAVAFSPDGARIASGDERGVLRFWDARTGEGLGAPVKAHDGQLSSLVFTPDGRRMVSASWDKTLRLWDGASGQPLGAPLLGHEGAIYELALSPDGARVASASWDNTIRLWDLHRGAALGEPLRGHRQDVTAVAFSADGARIISASLDLTLRQWDAASGAALGEALEAESPVVNLAFSPDGRQLVASARNLELRDPGSARLLHVLPGSGNAASLAFSPDGSRLLQGSGKLVRLWDAGGWREARPMRGHQADVRSVAFSPDGHSAVSGSDDGTVRLWAADGGPSFGRLLHGHEGAVQSLAFSADGTRVVSAGWDKSIRQWDARTGAPLSAPISGHEERIFAVAYSPDGASIASGSWDQTLRLWDASSGAPRLPPLRGHEGAIFALAFSPDGSRIASGSSDRTIRLWDAHSGAPVGHPLRHEDIVLGLAFSPDGQRIASSGQDGKLWLWDAASGKPVRTPQQAHEGAVWALAFSRDGKLLVSASDDGTLRLWDGASGEPLGAAMSGHRELVRSVAFSPDGTRLASKGGDGTLRLWDTATGQPVGQPLDSPGGQGLAFSPDGRQLATGHGELLSAGNDVLMLPAPAAWADELCTKLTRNLSRREWREWVSTQIDYVCQCPGLPVPADEAAAGARSQTCAAETP